MKDQDLPEYVPPSLVEQFQETWRHIDAYKEPEKSNSRTALERLVYLLDTGAAKSRVDVVLEATIKDLYPEGAPWRTNDVGVDVPGVRDGDGSLSGGSAPEEPRG